MPQFLLLTPTVMLLMTSYLASVRTPLEYTRRFTRDTTPYRRYNAAVGAAERVQVAEHVVNFIQLYLLCGDDLLSNPWSLVSVVGRIAAAAALDIDASWQFDIYLELLETDPRLVSSYDPIRMIANCLFLQATESLTLEPPEKKRRIGGHLLKIDDFCESECMSTFRFQKSDLFYLFEIFGIPDVVDIPVRDSNGAFTTRSNGRGGSHEYHVCGETCFLVFLARMAKAIDYEDLAKTFGFADQSLVSRVLNIEY